MKRTQTKIRDMPGARAHRAAARQIAKADFMGGGREDGMANVFTAMGTSLNRSRYTSFAPSQVLDWNTLESMYEGDGVVRRLIDLITTETNSRGYEIEGDTDGALYKMMEDKGLNKVVRDMTRWAELYGGALAPTIIDDGSDDLSKPLNVKNIRSVVSAQVFNRWRTWWTLNEAYRDPLSPKYMTPEVYKVIPLLGNVFSVHESRCVRMDGMPVSDRRRVRNLGWGDSRIQAVWEQLRQMATVFNGTERIVDGFLQEVLSIKNLSTLLQTDDGTNAVKKRLEIMDLSAGNFRRTLLDAELESYAKHSSTVTGLRDLLETFQQIWCGVTGVPMTKMFGSGPRGLASGGQGQTEERAWYDDLAAYQYEKLGPAIRRFVEWIAASDEYSGPLKGKEIIVKFKPLWNMSEIDEAKWKLAVAQADLIWLKLGVTPKEIITSRFGGDHFSDEIKLDPTITDEARAESAAQFAGNAGPGDTPAEEQKAAKEGALEENALVTGKPNGEGGAE